RGQLGESIVLLLWGRCGRDAEGGLHTGRAADNQLIGRLRGADSENRPVAAEPAAAGGLNVDGRHALAGRLAPVLGEWVDGVENVESTVLTCLAGRRGVEPEHAAGVDQA